MNRMCSVRVMTPEKSTELLGMYFLRKVLREDLKWTRKTGIGSTFSEGDHLGLSWFPYESVFNHLLRGKKCIYPFVQSPYHHQHYNVGKEGLFRSVRISPTSEES